MRNHIKQELHSTLHTLWEEPDERLVAHVHALNIIGDTRAVLEDTAAPEVLAVMDGVASAILDHGVSTLENKLNSWEGAQDNWELWRVDPCVINPRHPVSQALWVVHNGACTAMLQFAALNQVAQSSCKVSLSNAHERCAPPTPLPSVQSLTTNGFDQQLPTRAHIIIRACYQLQAQPCPPHSLPSGLRPA